MQPISVPSLASPSPHITGVGLAVVDYLGMLPRMPQFDEIEAVKMERWAITGGGPLGTALAIASRLGARCAVLGVLGDDMIGRQVRQIYIDENVDVSCLRMDPSIRSPSTIVLVESGTGKRSFLSFRDDDAQMELAEEDLNLINRSRYLHLDSWYPEIALQAARAAREAGVQVSLDAYRNISATAQLIALSDILIATESYPYRYTGIADLTEASDSLLKAGPWLVVTTLSDRGCYVATRSGHFHAPGFPVECVDTTGAGDAFHGAFLFGLLQGWDLPEVARFANAAGALACTMLGGRTAVTGLKAVEEFLVGATSQDRATPPD